ncbi:MAG: histidine phosphatase family protein [Flavobacteriales bacterium]
MKTLFIVRHGKSSWDDINLNDIDRPLKKRGAKNAKELGTHLRDERAKVDLLLSSPAKRAFETASIIVDFLEIDDTEFQIMESLYMPDFSTILKAILYTNDSVNNLMIVGHEPSITSLLNHFLIRPPEKVITASMTRIEFECNSWKDIQSSNVKTAHHCNRHDWKGFDIQ